MIIEWTPGEVEENRDWESRVNLGLDDPAFYDKAGFSPFQSLRWRMRHWPHLFTTRDDGVLEERIVIQTEPAAVESTIKPKRSVFTYLIQQQKDGPVKIGIARDVRKRLATLQTASPCKLHLLLSIPEDREKELHDRFAKHRLMGEWFLPDISILNYVASHRE